MVLKNTVAKPFFNFYHFLGAKVLALPSNVCKR